jgi:hypothetical protein
MFQEDEVNEARVMVSEAGVHTTKSFAEIGNTLKKVTDW